MDYYFGNSNLPDPNNNYGMNMAPASPEFMLSNYLMLDDHVDHHHHHHQDSCSWSQSTESSEKAASSDTSHGFRGATTSMNNNIKCKNESKRSNKVGVSQKIAFRTKSELEVMDDGYKWRKYGKKFVKNSPNPRNYYKCSSEGCKVKKRVERDRDDHSYVLTTYEGVHNHERPCSAYYSQMPFVHISNDWALQASANTSF